MPPLKRATAGKRSTAGTRVHTGDTTVERRDSTRESRRRTSFVAQQQGGGDAPRASTRSTAARTRSVAPRRGGGRGGKGGNNAMLYAIVGGVALLIVIAIAASAGAGTSPRPRRAPQGEPAPAGVSHAAASPSASSRPRLSPKKKTSPNAPPPDFKGAPKLNKFDDDKWSKTHKDTSVKNDLSKAEVDSRIAEARKLMKQVDATRKSEDRNALRRQVDALCNEAINSRNATEADRKEAQRLKWMAGKSQGVK